MISSTILLQLLSHLQRSQLLYFPFHQLLVVFYGHLLLQVLLGGLLLGLNLLFDKLAEEILAVLIEVCRCLLLLSLTLTLMGLAMAVQKVCSVVLS